jgi:hypothetical protein
MSSIFDILTMKTTYTFKLFLVFHPVDFKHYLLTFFQKRVMYTIFDLYVLIMFFLILMSRYDTKNLQNCFRKIFSDFLLSRLDRSVITKDYSRLILNFVSTICWDGGMFYGSSSAHDDDLDICEAVEGWYGMWYGKSHIILCLSYT